MTGTTRIISTTIQSRYIQASFRKHNYRYDVELYIPCSNPEVNGGLALHVTRLALPQEHKILHKYCISSSAENTGLVAGKGIGKSNEAVCKSSFHKVEDIV